MTIKTTEEILVSGVLETLASMSDITPVKVDEITIALFKEEAPFCLISEAGIYLRSDEEQEYIIFQDQKYSKTQISPDAKDDFLQVATKAYWIASGKWQREAQKPTELLNES